jgi:hypothetical protein
LAEVFLTVAFEVAAKADEPRNINAKMAIPNCDSRFDRISSSLKTGIPLRLQFGDFLFR